MSRNKSTKGHNKYIPLDYDTISERNILPKAQKNRSFVYYTVLTVHFDFTSIKSKEYPKIGNPMKFTQEPKNPLGIH